MIGFWALWLAVGVVGFFTMRWACELGSSCQPIRVKTLVGCAFMMWAPPLTFLIALIAIIVFVTEDHDGPVRRFLRREVVNPCKWFSRDEAR